jgi:hypothetical protein
MLVADNDVDASTYEHAAALGVDCTHGEAEDHDAEHVPGGRFSYGLFRDAAGIEHGRGQVAQDDCGSAPEADEGESDRSRNHDLGGQYRLRTANRRGGVA